MSALGGSRVRRDGPEARELRAAGLAALAEAGVVYLPLHMVLSETRGLEIDIELLALPFVVAYAVGTLLACRFRTSGGLATAAFVAAVLVGLYLGRGDLNRSVFMVVVTLLLSLRVVSLGLRDWRVPIEAELGWGAAALGLETIVGASGEPDWRPLLLVFVPTFFVASLASRASTVWTSGGADDLDDRVRGAWIRRAVFATGGLLAAMASAVALSVRGGVFDRVGGWLAPAADALASFFAHLVAQAARPVFWLVDRIGIDPEAVRRFLEGLREGGLRRRAEDELGTSGPSVWQRLLGAVAFAAIGYALYRVLRRYRPQLGERERRGSGAPVSEAPLSPEEAILPRRPRLRREMPADAVRRMYAEALLTLRARDLPKDPSLTPAEYSPIVAGAFPACAEGFRRLTRAYQDVRYGNRRPERDALRRLETDRGRLLSALRK